MDVDNHSFELNLARIIVANSSAAARTATRHLLWLRLWLWLLEWQWRNITAKLWQGHGMAHTHASLHRLSILPRHDELLRVPA